MNRSDIEKTLNNYTITPDNLWVVFYATSAGAQKFGANPVQHALCLADTQQQVVGATPQGVYGCSNLTHMRAMQQQLNASPLLIADTQRLIWKPEVFFLAVNDEHALRFYRVQAFTAQKAIAHLSSIIPNATVVVTGSQHDFDQLLEQMEHTLSTQAFDQIPSDRRELIDGVMAYKLLLCKCNPNAFANAFYDELHRIVHGCTEPKETDGIDPGVSVCFKTHQHR